MRKTAWVLTGLMVVSAAAAMAAEAPATDMSKDKGTMAAPAGDKMEKPMTKSKGAMWEHVTGEVTAMDATAKTFTVKAKSGDKNLKWDDKTVVTPKGQTPAMGDKVSVTMAKDSDMATKIAIHKASKKMDKMDKKPS